MGRVENRKKELPGWPVKGINIWYIIWGVSCFMISLTERKKTHLQTMFLVHLYREKSGFNVRSYTHK